MYFVVENSLEEKKVVVLINDSFYFINENMDVYVDKIIIEDISSIYYLNNNYLESIHPKTIQSMINIIL